MSENETKQKIGAAIVAASEKDYVEFKSSIGDEIEDRLRAAISTRSQEKREQQFTKLSVSDADDDSQDDD